MASAIGTLKWLANILIQFWDHDPGATTAKLVSPDGGTTIRYLDMSLYSRFAVAAFPTVIGGGGLTKLEIVASSDAAFTAPVVVKDSGVIAADAAGDWVVLECTAEEIVQLGDDLQYVAGRLTQATATDEAAVMYLAQPRFAHKDLTPATTIA